MPPHGCLHPALMRIWNHARSVHFTQNPELHPFTHSSTSRGDRRYNPQKKDGVRVSHCCAVTAGGDRPHPPSSVVTGNIKTYPAFLSQVLVTLMLRPLEAPTSLFVLPFCSRAAASQLPERQARSGTESFLCPPGTLGPWWNSYNPLQLSGQEGHDSKKVSNTAVNVL